MGGPEGAAGLVRPEARRHDVAGGDTQQHVRAARLLRQRHMSRRLLQACGRPSTSCNDTGMPGVGVSKSNQIRQGPKGYRGILCVGDKLEVEFQRRWTCRGDGHRAWWIAEKYTASPREPNLKAMFHRLLWCYCTRERV